jgi:hypothetical protein
MLAADTGDCHLLLAIAALDAYGWSDLAPLLRIAHGNAASLPPRAREGAEGGRGQVEAAVAMSRDEAKRAFDEAVLERMVALNAELAAEEARGLVRWLRPEFQNPTAQTVPQQAEMQTDTDEATTTKPAVATKPLPWPKDAVDQVRAVANILAASPQPLTIDDIAARFTSRGAWKKRLPPLLEMLVALGRAQERRGWYSVSK